jgi:hypothetical protein
MCLWACSSVWLERSADNRKVESSNLSRPTFKPKITLFSEIKLKKWLICEKEKCSSLDTNSFCEPKMPEKIIAILSTKLDETSLGISFMCFHLFRSASTRIHKYLWINSISSLEVPSKRHEYGWTKLKFAACSWRSASRILSPMWKM